MTNEEQRIAIAKACAFKIQDFESWRHIDDLDGIVIPDYLNDLNAMHDAEKVLDQQQVIQYWRTLAYACDKDGMTDMLFKTAAQRAKAFLRTIGKWID